MAVIVDKSDSNLRIVGTNQRDTIETGDGNDTIFGRGGDDSVFSDLGNDRLLGEGGHDHLRSSSGDDRLFGGTGNDLLDGSGGNDRLAVEVGFSNFGTDVLEGDSGFDVIAFETARVREVNGSPAQIEIESATRGVLVNLINVFLPGRIEDFDLSRIDENGELEITLEDERGRILDGTSLGSTNFGPDGVVDAIDEESSVFADIEEFELTAQEDYFLDSVANHVITGRGGNDFISGGGGADTIDGGSGRDTALYGGSSVAVSISLLDFGNGGSGTGGDAEGDKLFSVENVFGSSFNDSVIGSTAGNVLRGRGGDDGLLGLGGTDTLFGEDGADTLTGGLDADTVSGGRDADTLNGGSGNDTLDGGSGSDTALFRSWNDAESSGFIRGSIALGEGSTAGSAVLSSTFLGLPPRTVQIERDTLRGVENVVGSDFTETITGNSAANTLEGRGGGDTINGRQGADTLLGGDGDDRLTGGVGGHLQLVLGGRLADTDFLSGGAGEDTADYSGNIGRVAVTLGLNGADGGATEFGSRFGITSDTLRSIENVVGSGENDTIVGNEGDNALSGRDGDDVMEGLEGSDEFIGGEGSDTASYAGADIRVVASLAGATVDFFAAAGDSYISIENLTGSRFNDFLEGDGLGNILTGGDDDDQLLGNDGDDTLNGEVGDDTLIGGLGADILNGDEGIDTASYETAAAAVTADLLNAGTNTGEAAGDTYIAVNNLRGSAGFDTLRGNNNVNVIDGGDGDDTLVGRDGGDTLSGGLNDDTLSGNIGDDTLNGGNGIDELFGGFNNDDLFGNQGNDTLNGGAANDDMFGGFNSDTYQSGVGNDTIFDAAGAADQLQIASLDAIASSTRVGDDLIVELTGGQTITIQNHFIAANRVETLTDGTETVVLAAGLTGGDASGIISGSDANEVLDGRGGDDILFGAGGRDWLIGGVGDDRLHGGPGGDTLTGGPGDDIFVLTLDPASDTVTDFAPGSDRIAFERASFGFSADEDLADLLCIGGYRPYEGEALHVTEDGYVLYDDNWATLSGRHIVAQLVEVWADDLQMSDFLLV